MQAGHTHALALTVARGACTLMRPHLPPPVHTKGPVCAAAFIAWKSWGAQDVVLLFPPPPAPAVGCI